MNRETMLIEPDELLARLGRDELRIFDASVSDAAYREGHIPGAAFFDHARFSDPASPYAARAWWVLHFAGHDRVRLNQVMSNLIANALRYTPPGGEISVAVGPGSSEGRSTSLVVRDTGSGFASEDLAFIFDRSWRADRSRGERAHSGLGLAITRQLVHAHDGTIDVQSTVGSGTTFRLEFA